jgi:hypothetical protein
MNRDPIEINGRIWIYDASSRTHRPAETVDNRSRNLAAVPVAAEQRVKRKARHATKKDCAISERVDIEVYTYRVHTCDTEAVFIKHAIDAIVDRGVIQDDSAAEVASIKFYAAEKVATYEEEGHRIVLRACR